MSDDFAANYPLLVSREQGRNAIGKALGLFVGSRARLSVKELANATGVRDWMIEKAMIDAGSPDHRPLPPEALLSIALYLGADFTNGWIKLAKQGAFNLPEEEPDPGKLAADTSDDTAKVVRMAIDGDLHNDSPQDLRTTGARMMSHGAQLVAVAARA